MAIIKNDKILLPDSLSNVLIDVALDNNLASIKNNGNTTLLTFGWDPITKKYTRTSKNDSYLHSYHNNYKQERYDFQKEQQLYQLLLLYDDVIFSYPSLLSDSYDWTELEKTGNVTHLESSDLYNTEAHEALENIDYNLYQYLKPAVFDQLKEKLKDEYERVNRNYSRNVFVSILYELFFSRDEDATIALILGEYDRDGFERLLKELNIMIEDEKDDMSFEENISFENVEQIRAFLANYRNYIDPRNTSPFLSHDPDRFTYYDFLGEDIINPIIYTVLEELEISTRYSVDILNPSYSIEKLGCKGQNIANIDDAYGTLKIQCADYISSFVQLSSIQETLDFKEKNAVSVKRLQNVFGELLNVLENDGRERMIKKAAEDIRKATKELNFGKTLTKIDTWTIFTTLPIAMIENYLSMPNIASTSLGIYALGSFFVKKHIQERNNWVAIIRA